ncbi:radical SAM family heme chaperone HemW [Thiomonas intermedia]|uniref:radical SAM family heme chaperone HemW n=1 Tax=Thiomonas intermedia TaxID=926 RepID=UPI003CCBB870
MKPKHIPIVEAGAASVAPGDAAPQRAAQSLPHYMRPGTLQFQSLPPLSLYVHLPWCLKKCPYCDFNSHEWRAGGAIPEQAYLAALRADLDAALPLVWGRRVISVFIGGGTPSLFSPEAIDQLITDVRARLPLVADAEITLEANPGTFEQDRFAAFAQAGVNRLSIGVQSFNDDRLRALGRVHDARQAHDAVAEAARHFASFNLDLMFALPQQDMAGCKADVIEALAHQPPHLSLYQLTLEPNTLFARQPPPLPDDDLGADMQHAVADLAEAAGLQRYEVSAYAAAGHSCRHNLNYWQFGDYLGIGAGAHSKITFAHRIVRQTRWRHPQRYSEQAERASAVETEVEVARRDLPFEFMLNALRLREGVPAELFTERTGLPPSTIHQALQAAQSQRLMVEPDTRLQTTPLGFNMLNNVLELFLPE